MRYGRPAALVMMVAALLVGAACRGEPTPTQAPPTTRPAPAPVEPDELSIVYTQHGLAGSHELTADGGRLTLVGVDQVTTWISDTDSGVLTTEEFVANWDAFGLDESPPQAAVIAGQLGGPRTVVELYEPTWEPFFQAISYRTRPVADPETRLAPLIDGDAPADLPATFGAVTLYVLQPDAPAEPFPTTTTTTTSTTTTTAPPDSSLPPTSGASPTSPSSLPPTVPTVITPPTSALPPTGPAFITLSPNFLEFPVGGGVRTVTLANIGSGVGSWSAKVQNGTGMTVSPSSGFILPGSSVVLQVSYNGNGPASDFATRIEIQAPNGTLLIDIVVG